MRLQSLFEIADEVYLLAVDRWYFHFGGIFCVDDLLYSESGLIVRMLSQSE